jgi:hypothetical protein
MMHGPSAGRVREVEGKLLQRKEEIQRFEGEYRQVCEGLFCFKTSNSVFTGGRAAVTCVLGNSAESGLLNGLDAVVFRAVASMIARKNGPASVAHAQERLQEAVM